MDCMRQIVFLLLVPSMLLSQAAAMPHLHAGSVLAGHGWRSHVHVHQEAVRHVLHESHHHHDSHDSDEHDDGLTDNRQVPVSQSEHDADTIYVDSLNLAVGLSSVSDALHTLHTLLAWGAVACGIRIPEQAADLQPRIERRHPVDGDGYHCALHVRQCLLVI